MGPESNEIRVVTENYIIIHIIIRVEINITSTFVVFIQVVGPALER